MNFFADEQRLTAHFLTAWALPGNPHRLVPVDSLSEKKSPAADGSIVKFRVKRVPSRHFAIGGTRRNMGSVLIQLILPMGKGAGQLTKMADAVSEIFAPNNTPVRIGPLKCRLPSAAGPFEESTLVTMNVDIPWSSDYN